MSENPSPHWCKVLGLYTDTPIRGQGHNFGPVQDDR